MFVFFSQELTYQEFFTQGDLEKAIGIPPLEMYDKEKAFISELQLKFLDHIARPVYHKDLRDAVWGEQWEEVRRIIRRQPLLVNEEYLGWSLLYQIVWQSPPRDVVAGSLKSATAEAVDYVDNWYLGDCTLHRIAKLGYAQEMRESLMISARNVNLQDKRWQETPLHKLLKTKHIFRDHLDIARLLLDAGADVNIENKDNETPRDLYIQNECEEYDSTNREKHKEEVLQLLQDYVVPEVILARGSEALKVFNEELQEGRITVNHARLMVTGKEGVGKTCLVNTLLERTFNEEEPSTDGIVLTTAFQTTDISSVWKEAEDMDECDRIKDIFDNALESKVAEKLKQKGSQVEAAEPVQASAGKSTPVPPLVHAPKKSNVFVRVFQRLTKKDGRRKPVTSSTPVLPSVPVPVEVGHNIVIVCVFRVSSTDDQINYYNCGI
ncbi:uncharacterized protein LOC117106676 isoform X2 [Anneissia japonica]|uniref:uncharacterized protein LOC117106676 isoform X2 n=1 Tax=Anneissia japonica TaxID=1529436 RepID=UPI001425612D|nr:uncharacterized protein LOC117106676 isoform X2 [Anneissia japonica]